MSHASRDAVVVDASVVIKWLIPEEDSAEARELERQWREDGITVSAPHLMPYEVSNALHKRVATGEMSTIDAQRLMEDLLNRGIALLDLADTYSDAFELASRFNQRTIYDSQYLALAQALGCEFWTADERFYRAVTNELSNVRLLNEAAALNG